MPSSFLLDVVCRSESVVAAQVTPRPMRIDTNDAKFLRQQSLVEQRGIRRSDDIVLEIIDPVFSAAARTKRNVSSPT